MNRDQRLVLVAGILGSFVAFLDIAVVNVALPAIRRELDGGISAQQWVVDAYLLTLVSLILIAGSLSDLFGRRRMFAAGLIGFAIASALCAVVPRIENLIAARGLQGMTGALLVPSSLALIISHFEGAAQGKAIGTWTAWTGISFALGPLVGGALVDGGSWRWVFAHQYRSGRGDLPGAGARASRTRDRAGICRWMFWASGCAPRDWGNHLRAHRAAVARLGGAVHLLAAGGGTDGVRRFPEDEDSV